jgi:hypothetical protein
MSRIVPLSLVATLCLVLGGAQAAHAKQYRFVAEHPIPDGGFCHIHAPHVHVYAPARTDILYRNHDGWSYFVGDPVAYGYDGPRVAYTGAHPIHVDVVIGETEVDGDEIEYCYLKGPHYHIAAPPPDTHFEVHGDAYWYMGTFPPEFEAERPKLARINVVYEPIEYARPVIEVQPPRGWVDVLVVVPAGHAHVDAVVPPPPVVEGGVGVGFSAGVQVHVPSPFIDVHVGGPPAVIVEDHHHHHGDVRVKAKGKHKKVKVKVKAKGRF